MQFLEVEKHTGGIDHVKSPVQPERNVTVEKRLKRFDSLFVGNRRSGLRRLDSEHRVAEGLVMLELCSVVRADIEDRFVRAALHERAVDLPRDTGEVIAQSFSDARKIRVVPEHDLFLD